MFYVDQFGILQDLYLTNETTVWNRGLLASLNHNASTVPGGALSASFYLESYGINRGIGGGIRLFANSGSDGNVLFELSYDYDTSTWARGFRFDDSNGRAGAAVVGGTDMTTLHLINRQNNLEIWWWLSSNTATKNDFPAGNWMKGMLTSTLYFSIFVEYKVNRFYYRRPRSRSTCPFNLLRRSLY